MHSLLAMLRSLRSIGCVSIKDAPMACIACCTIIVQQLTSGENDRWGSSSLSRRNSHAFHLRTMNLRKLVCTLMLCLTSAWT